MEDVKTVNMGWVVWKWEVLKQIKGRKVNAEDDEDHKMMTTQAVGEIIKGVGGPH